MRLICTTGAAAEHLPPDGQARDELLGLIRIGLRFRASQDAGGHPGPLQVYLTGLVRRIGQPVTFERLLLELAYESSRRELFGATASPVESLNRSMETLIYHHPRRGRIHVPFKTIRNTLTKVKKNLQPAIPDGL
jgi:hypothetical protein